MSEHVIAASLKMDSKDANQSVKSFKTELKEANQNLLQVQQSFGPVSKEALQAAKRVAELKDQMQDAREVADLFDPGAKFQAFGNIARTAAGGMAALTGTMALFGEESEDVQKALLKVQGALAISEGLNTIFDSAKDFERLGSILKTNTVIATAWNFVQTGSFKAAKQSTAATVEQTIATKAQGAATVSTATATVGASGALKLLRAALIATGIGAVVVALVALYQNFDTVKKYIEKLTGPLDHITKFFGKLVDTVTDFAGVTSEASRATAKMIKDIEKSISGTERFLDLNADKYDQYTQRKIAADLDYKKKKVALLKDETLSEDQRIKLIEQAEDQRTRLIKSASTDRAKAEDGINQAAAEKAKAARDKAIAERKKHADEIKQIEDQAAKQLLSLQQTNYLASIKDDRKREEERLRLTYESSVKEVEGLKLSGSTKASILSELKTQNNNELKAISDKYIKEEEAAEKSLQEYKNNLAIELILNSDERKAAQAKKELQNKIAEINASKLAEEEKQAAIKQVQDNYNAIRDFEAKERVIKTFSAMEDDIKNENLSFEARYKAVQDREKLINEAIGLSERERTNLLRENANARNEIDKQEKENKEKTLQETANLLGQAATLFGKQTAAGKAMAMGQAAIDTYSSANKAYASLAGIPIVGPALGAAAAGLAIVTGLKNMREIAKVKVPGGGGASAPNISAPAPLQPPRPVETSTRLPQDQINQIGNAAAGGVNRAFVIESDVSSNQQKIAMLNRAARLGA